MTRRTSPLRDAERLQRAAARTGFDWDRLDPLWEKLDEEIRELRADARVPQRALDELGDLLFMVVNVARHLGIDPSRALAGANRKFSRRFAHVLRHAAALPPIGHPDRLARMEEYWVEAKRLEKCAPRKRAAPRGRGARRA